eukprot:1326216-Lingulodinium_polyedra.AAC.1
MIRRTPRFDPPPTVCALQGLGFSSEIIRVGNDPEKIRMAPAQEWCTRREVTQVYIARTRQACAI